MRFNSSIALRAANTLAAMLTLITLGSQTTQAGSCCGSGGAASSCSSSSCGGGCGSCERAQQAPFAAPHGGELTKTLWNYVEIVYGPEETRVYLYDSFRFPQRVGRVEGQMELQVHSTGRKFSYPLAAVASDQGQDYLVAKVNLTHVAPGDMDVTVNLHQVPGSADPVTKVTQVFAGATLPGRAGVNQYSPSTGEGNLSRPAVPSCCAAGHPAQTLANTDAPSRPAVKPQNASLVRPLPPVDVEGDSFGAQAQTSPPINMIAMQTTSADNAAIQRQRVCPVTGQLLGSHGQPTKVLIGDHALYLCCAGCLPEVQRRPETYLAVANRQ